MFAPLSPDTPSRTNRRTGPSRSTRAALAAAALALSLVCAATVAPSAFAASAGGAAVDDTVAEPPLLTLLNHTAITEFGNGASEAVVGESVSYTASLVIPAHTGVYDGVLSSPLPAGLALGSASAAFAATGVAPATGPLPPGVTLNPVNGTLRFGSTYANNTSSNQLFQVTLDARVAVNPTTNQGTPRLSTSTLRRSVSAGGPALPAITATSVVTVVVPSPWLRVTDDDADDAVAAGQQLNFKLRADNVVGRPDGHDGWLVACVPAGLSFGAFTSNPGGATTSPGNGTNGCRSEQTRIAWNVDDVSEAGELLSYTATVDTNATAGTVYTTSAVLTASTLRDGKADPSAPDNPIERSLVRVEEHTITAIGRAADLAITQELAGDVVAGSAATYSVTVANLGPSSSAGPITVTDDLPAGVGFVSAEGPTWSCDQGAGTVICTGPNGLAPGEVAPALTLTVDVPADRTAALTNVARVDGPDLDPVAGNDESSLTTLPVGSADLSIEKELVGEIVAGDEATYRFTVHNAGPSFASTVGITDVLPEELGFVRSTSVVGSWSCAAVDQAVTCDLSDGLADGADAVVEIDVDVASGHTGSTHNEAGVTSSTADPNPANNSDADDSVNVVRSDLSVDSSHPGSAIAGTNVTYTLDVANNGPSDSSASLVVTDVLPVGMSFVSADGAGWSCENDAQTVTCTRAAALAGSASAPAITLVAAIASDAGPATLDNVVSVDVPETDPEPTNNSDVDPTEIVDAANLVVAKTSQSDGPVIAGTTTSFRIDVTNDGPSDADAVSVVDTLPAGMTVVPISGNGWTCEAVLLVACARDRIVAGATREIYVVVRVASAVPDGASLTNAATATTTTPGDEPADNTDDADVDVLASADLSLLKSHQGTEVAAGTQVTFDLDVSNAGPSDAPSPITVVDTLPPGFAFAASSVPWICSAEPAGPAGQEVTCALPTALSVGADAPTLSITAQVGSFVDAGTHTNSAQVSSNASDPVPSNNTDIDDVDVFTTADVSVIASHVAAARVGDPLDLTLAVTNGGPSDARGVVVSDVLPAGLEYMAATGAGWTCTALGADVTCDHSGPLAPGSAGAITLTARVLPSAYPGVANAATVAAATHDPDAADNSSIDPILVPPQVDVSIVKHHPQPLRVGRNVGYRLTVTNTGPTAEPGTVTVVDQLPQGLVFVAADSLAFECDDVGQTVTCTRDSGLAVGERYVIVVIATVTQAAFPQVDNTGTVSSPSEDVDLSNNSSTDPGPVLPA